MLDKEDKLPFFDVLLQLKQDPHDHLWFLETSVFFKEADELRRTHASSFWSWDHAEALLRSHLDRIAKICSSPHTTLEALETLGTLLARRGHPLEQLILSFRRLNPSFLAESEVSAVTLDEGAEGMGGIFGSWKPDEVPFTKRLAGTIPFGGPVNEQVKRITAEFLNEIAKRIREASEAEVVVTVNNSPFKNLTRTEDLSPP